MRRTEKRLWRRKCIHSLLVGFNSVPNSSMDDRPVTAAPWKLGELKWTLLIGLKFASMLIFHIFLTFFQSLSLLPQFKWVDTALWSFKKSHPKLSSHAVHFSSLLCCLPFPFLPSLSGKARLSSIAYNTCIYGSHQKYNTCFKERPRTFPEDKTLLDLVSHLATCHPPNIPHQPTPPYLTETKPKRKIRKKSKCQGEKFTLTKYLWSAQQFYSPHFVFPLYTPHFFFPLFACVFVY